MLIQQRIAVLATAAAIAAAAAWPAEAGLFDRAVSRAVAKRVVTGKVARLPGRFSADNLVRNNHNLPPIKSATPIPAQGGSSAAFASRPKDVVVHRRQYPEAAAHIEHAQRTGQPTILTLDRRHAAERRAASLRGIKDPSHPNGRDRDEYPPAMTSEGGQGSTVHFIDAHDNRGAGSSIRHQTKDLPDGTRIRVLVTE